MSKATRNSKPSADPVQPPRCWGYARVSTDVQADSGISLDEQRNQIECRCREKGWDLQHVYVDAGVSGSTPLGKRPEGAKLLAAVQSGDVIVAARMDRCFRSALDALQTIQGFKRRHISLWLLDLGDVSGNGVSQLILVVLSAVAEFERSLISERIKDAKRNLRRQGKHLGGSRPFGFAFGPPNGHGRARLLLPDPVEQQAIVDIKMMRASGMSLMSIRDQMRARGHWVSHQLVNSITKSVTKSGSGQ